MSSLRNPVGPLPAKVYWRRRIYVLLGFLAVLAVILLIIFRPQGDPDQGGEEQPGTGGIETPGPETPGTEEPGTEQPGDGSSASSFAGAEAKVVFDGKDFVAELPPKPSVCLPGQITLTAKADNTTYQAGELPQLWFEIVNTGSSDCVLDVGTAEQVFEISSAGESYWNSTHCEADPQSFEVTLKANQPQATSPLGWDRTRSSVAQCNAGAIPNVADAMYQFKVSVGSIESEPINLRILN